jgi:hypothetical protein
MRRYSINPSAGRSSDSAVTERAVLAYQDAHGTVEQQVHDTGANYWFAEIDHLALLSESLRATRSIAIIPEGQRTELAYWTPDAPAKKLHVHQGIGTLVLANPATGLTRNFALDPEITPVISLPPSRFYSLEAEVKTPVPLVVSGLYGAEPIDWDILEILVQPGQEALMAAGTEVHVPDEFRARYS